MLSLALVRGQYILGHVTITMVGKAWQNVGHELAFLVL